MTLLNDSVKALGPFLGKHKTTKQTQKNNQTKTNQPKEKPKKHQITKTQQ